jgi:hypothetical protein
MPNQRFLQNISIEANKPDKKNLLRSAALIKKPRSKLLGFFIFYTYCSSIRRDVACSASLPEIQNYLFAISRLLILMFLTPVETIKPAGCIAAEFAILPLTRYCVADFKFVKDTWGVTDGLFLKAIAVATLL